MLSECVFQLIYNVIVIISIIVVVYNIVFFCSLRYYIRIPFFLPYDIYATLRKSSSARFINIRIYIYIFE